MSFSALTPYVRNHGYSADDCALLYGVLPCWKKVVFSIGLFFRQQTKTTLEPPLTVTSLQRSISSVLCNSGSRSNQRNRSFFVNSPFVLAQFSPIVDIVTTFVRFSIISTFVLFFLSVKLLFGGLFPSIGCNFVHEGDYIVAL